MLNVLHALPDGLLAITASRLHQVLKGPTLIHLPGRTGPTLYLSVLLHGNETSGWEAVRWVLAERLPRGLPRPVSLFIGNVSAAHAGLRRLDGQVDYNRIWSGGDLPEHEMAAEILAEMRGRRLFAALDIHNTSGRNPRYACITSLAPETVGLAKLFDGVTVYATSPATVATMAFADLCPSITLECGLPGDPDGIAAARDAIEAGLDLEHIAPVSDLDTLHLYHTVATVKIAPDLSIGPAAANTDVALPDDLEAMNFSVLPAGTVMARVRTGVGAPFEVIDQDGAAVADLYFEPRGEVWVNRVPIIPAMLSPDERIIRQDCLCYLMEQYPG